MSLNARADAKRSRKSGTRNSFPTLINHLIYDTIPYHRLYHANATGTTCQYSHAKRRCAVHGCINYLIVTNFNL